MIAFQTLFLGLVFGFGSVRMMVSPPVATVELYLDGASVGTVSGEPWEVACRFGAAPLPHELVAVGRDAAGKEIGRVRQFVNLPRPAAEARILVEPGAGRKPTFVRLAWSTIDNAKPKRFDVSLDGSPIAVQDPQRIELAGIDLRRSHFLSAEVVFPKGVVAKAEASIGGEAEAAAATELTAIAVVLRPGQELPPIDAMQTWFLKAGQPLRVVAVEEGHADAVVVFDQDSGQRFGGITRPNAFLAGGIRWNAEGGRVTAGNEIPLQPSKGGNRLLAIWAVPTPTRSAGGAESRGLFRVSIPLDLDVDEMRTLIFRFAFPAAAPKAQALANAVATAGMQAASLNRRRAVALFVGEAPPDSSTMTVDAARAYLESINVPLFVWSPDRRISELALPGWGLPDDVSTDLQFQGAVTRLQNALAAQRIVWLAGSHLPQSVTIAPGVKQVFLARGVLRVPRTPRS